MSALVATTLQRAGALPGRFDQAGLRAFLRFVIPPHQRVLFVRTDHEDDQRTCNSNGCTEIIQQALSFRVADLSLSVEGARTPFDYIVLSNALDYCPNIGSLLHQVRQLCAPHTRIIVSSRRGFLTALWRLVWAPGIDRMDQPRNLLSETETKTIMESCGFERIGSRRSFPRASLAARIGHVPVQEATGLRQGEARYVRYLPADPAGASRSRR